MADKNDKNMKRFAGVQRIIVFSIMIVALVVVATNFLPQNNEEAGVGVSILEPAVDVRNEDSSLFGNIKITADDGFSLEYAQVLINGISFGDFKDGEVLVRVYPGDVVSIDGSAYKRELGFHVTSVSSNISKDYVSTSLTTNGNIVDVGIIVFK
ncbi:MAG: hypothetical protein HP052_02900 [Firmicutes bacterium]|nr:hypothetical protein [Bacillota bacterium]